MFQVNDVIIYGMQGVCKITGTEEKIISRKRRTYYVLKPVRDEASTVFVPTDNACVLGKMRRLLTKDEIYRLVASTPEENTTWETDENIRRELFKDILAKGDPAELMKMLKVIYAHKQAREAAGKRLHMSDERFFKDAEQILYNEFQYVLDITSKDELLTHLFSQHKKE